MPSVTLPDGKQLEVRPGDRARDVVESIGPRLARDAVVAKLDGQVVDLEAPVDGGGAFEVLTKDSPEAASSPSGRPSRTGSSTTSRLRGA
jgi:threonyl-tRNA synthetase